MMQQSHRMLWVGSWEVADVMFYGGDSQASLCPEISPSEEMLKCPDNDTDSAESGGGLSIILSLSRAR